MKRTPGRRVVYTVTDGAWRGSLTLRFQLSFYPRAKSERYVVTPDPSVPARRVQRVRPLVSASRIHWGPDKTGEWSTEVREGSAADRHLQAVLHGSFDAGPMRRRVVP